LLAIFGLDKFNLFSDKKQRKPKPLIKSFFLKSLLFVFNQKVKKVTNLSKKELFFVIEEKTN
jgi:hypothetical protein